MLSRAAKPSQFTKYLTPDSLIPTIEASEAAAPESLRKARKVIGSFTWVKPEQRPEHELKWVSKAALDDLGLDSSNESADDRKDMSEVLSGSKVVTDLEQQLYPFAQNYAGDQFGSHAGQLGDGRAITLFRVGNYDIQLKGAGLTPYSRFADGKAVLRSSIREALASEYMNQLGIPTQRCLSLVTLPATFARRERIEPCAVIARMAPSWIRIGTFQLHQTRGDRSELRKLADYCINELHIGAKPESAGAIDDSDMKNRYFWFFRDVALRNAKMMAKCSAYGFLNGVLNTDNVSVLGLSIDYGPFAFMDVFDSSYTPNHDDYMGRYNFQNSPVIMWWNCVKLAESLGELIGSGNKVDTPEFVANGCDGNEEIESAVAKTATNLILGVGKEFQQVYESHYQQLMMQRLGIFASDEPNDLGLIEGLLRTMQECEIDYNLFFRRLGEPGWKEKVLPAERERKAMLTDSDAQKMIETWSQKYEERKSRDEVPEEERRRRMNEINPRFVLRNSVLANVIDLAQHGNWDAFNAAATMALHPFADSWPGVDNMYIQRYLADPALADRSTQLSCSS